MGRADQLASLVAAALDPPSLLLVEGEAGIGKTRLIAELRRHPAVARHRTLVGGCCAIREPFPLGPVLEAVRNLSTELRPERLSPVAGALRPLLPELGPVLPPTPEPLDNPAADRHRLFRGLVELLAAVAPLILVLEDLHWADDQTVDFLRYLLSDPPDGLFLVATFRGVEAGPGLRGLGGASLPARVTRSELVLPPLDVRQTGELAAAIVGADGVSEDFAAYLCERTGGLPFAIEQVMALLRERGVVAQDGFRWPRHTLDELTVPVALRDHVLERSRLLGPPARSMLAALAVLQQPAPERLIAAVLRMPTAEVTAGLSEALQTGLLVDHGTTVGFRHTLAAQAVYDGVSGPRRRELHHRAADALRERGLGPLGQIAYHLRNAGRREEWAEAAERAADQAVMLGNHDEAARLLEEVLRHGAPGPETAGRLAIKLGWAATETLRVAGVSDLLVAALDQDQRRPVRGELQYLLAVLLDQAQHDPTRVHELFRQAVANLAQRPALQARALVSLALRSHPEDPVARRKRWLDRALALLPKLADPACEVFLLGKAGSVLVDMGAAQWREVADRVRGYSPGPPETRHQANAWYSIGSAACFNGHHQLSNGLLTGALTGAVATQNQRLEAFVRSALLVLDYSRGSWDGLDEAGDRLIAQLAEYPACRYLARSIAGCLAIARGEPEHALRELTPVVNRPLAGSYSVTIAAAGLARLAVAREDPVAAAGTATAYLSLYGPRAPLGPFIFRALPWLVEALLAGGQPVEARALLTRCARELRRADAPLAPAALRHARGFVALADEAPAAAAHHFLTAGERYELRLCPYEAAQARELAARSLLAAGDQDRVDEPLRAALATFERIGAGWDLGRAARFARQHGVSVPARHRGGHRGYGDELSPREREVAELAATGRTNKEIAGELFLSAETVKKHLQAVMRKLGVPSRAALARQLLERAQG